MAVLFIAVVVALIAGLTTGSAPAAEGHGTLRPINRDGLGNPNNYGFHRLYQFQGYLWTVAGNRVQGAIVYRSRDGKRWEAVSRPGFDGDLSNDSIASLAWFKGKLYAATYCFRCTGQRNGGDLWRANADAKDPKDVVWEKITKNGFGRPEIQAFVGFVAFKGHLYAGTFVNLFPLESGAYIFRTDTGDRGDWHEVVPRGMDDPQCNTDFHLNIVFGNHVYFGSEEAGCIGRKGGEIWRTDGNLRDGQTTLDGWEKVTAMPGFGHPWNNNIFGMDVFRGHYYAGTWVWGGGMEIFRAPVVPPHEGVTPAPFSFEQASLPGVNGDPRNSINIAMVHLGDTLYVAGADLLGQGNGYFYRTDGGAAATDQILNWTEITGEGFPPPTGGGVLPLDGPFWLETFKGKVYIVVEQGGHGTDGRGQIWEYEPKSVPHVRIKSVAPRCVRAGSSITIKGADFDDYQGDAYPMLGGRPIPVRKWTDAEIVATVPRGGTSSSVAVYRDGEVSNAKRVTVGRC